MTHRMKVLGLALMAIAAVGAFSASYAMGSELHFYNSTNVTGEQVELNSFTTDAGTVQCTQATFEGTLVESAEMNELTLTGTNTGCQGFGQPAAIDMNGCKYTVTGAAQPAQTAVVDITGCTTGKSIEITAGGVCRMSIPEQHGLNHITFEGVSGTKHVKAKATIQGISYISHGPLCPNLASSTPLKQNGQYTGQITVKALDDIGSELVTHNGHQYNKLKCGDQIGLLVT